MVLYKYPLEFSTIWTHISSFLYVLFRTPHLLEEDEAVITSACFIYLSTVFFITEIVSNHKVVMARRVKDVHQYDLGAVFHSWGVLGSTGWIIYGEASVKGHGTLAYHLSYGMVLYFYILFVAFRELDTNDYLEFSSPSEHDSSKEPEHELETDALLGEDRVASTTEKEKNKNDLLYMRKQPRMIHFRAIVILWVLFRSVAWIMGLEDIREKGWSSLQWGHYWKAEGVIYLFSMVFMVLIRVPVNKLVIAFVLYISMLVAADTYYVVGGSTYDTGNDFSTFNAYSSLILIAGSTLSIPIRENLHKLVDFGKKDSSVVILTDAYDPSHSRAVWGCRVAAGMFASFRLVGWGAGVYEIRNGGWNEHQWEIYWIAEICVVAVVTLIGLGTRIHTRSIYWISYVFYAILVVFSDGFVILGGHPKDIGGSGASGEKTYATYMTYTSSLSVAASVPLLLHSFNFVK